MNYENKKKELEEKFEVVKKEMETLDAQKQEKMQELLRLQGEYRLITSLIEQKDTA